MNFKILKFKRGYSIIEIIIYIAIFIAVSIAVINSFVVVMNSFVSARTNQDLLTSGNDALERVSREIRQATSVDVANSTLGSSPGILQMNSVDSGGTARISKIAYVSGALDIYNNGVLIGNLVGQNVLVTNLVFRRISTTNGEAVKVELTLQDQRAPYYKSENFYDTVILRGKY